jgi:hypothetical protein
VTRLSDSVSHGDMPAARRAFLSQVTRTISAWRSAARSAAAVKTLDEFYPSRGARDGRRPECKACLNAVRKKRYQAKRRQEKERVKQWQQANADKIRAWRERNREPRAKRSREIHLRRKFGLSLPGVPTNA